MVSTLTIGKVTEWSNKYAVSVNALSTGITKASASMAAGNNSLEQTFGLVAAGKFCARLYRNIQYKRPLTAGKSLTGQSCHMVYI